MNRQEQSLTSLTLEQYGYPKGTLACQPPSLDLLNAGLVSTPELPKEFSQDSRLLEQARERRDLHEQFNTIFAKVPDVSMDWEEAISSNLITSEEVRAVYERLADFLNRDKNNRRLILYLPFELLLAQSAQNLVGKETWERLRQSYTTAWIHTLFETDIRANYVDGDIPEPELRRGEIQEVHKAAHLIPELLANKWIDADTINAVIEVCEDPNIVRDIKAGLRSATARGIDTGTHKSDGPRIRNSQQDTQFEMELTLETIKIDLQRHVRLYSDSSALVQPMTKPRLRWEKEDRYEKIVDRGAKLLSRAYLGTDFSPQDLRGRVPDRMVIRSVIAFTESQAVQDIEIARSFFTRQQSILEEMWTTGSIEEKNELYSGWSHLANLGVIEDDYLHQFGLRLPKPGEPTSFDLNDFSHSEYRGLNSALTLIKQDESLREIVPALFFLWGSPSKGYPTLKSDRDYIGSVNIDLADSDAIRRAKTKVAQALDGSEYLLTFSTRREDGVLKFVHPADKEKGTISPTVTQPLFGSIWIGDEATIKDVKTSLFRQFLDLSRFGSEEEKQSARSQLLRRLEGETIRARLLQRGYRFFYPNAIPADIKQDTDIDGNSDFWDPGFRRIATKLFLSKVFLPDLS